MYYMDEDIKEEFTKIVTDFIKDLSNTFPEYKNNLIIHLEKENGVVELYDYCKTVYPERFFDILYQNVEIFTNDEINTKFFPEIDFKDLWKCNITDRTRETIWKYLQLMLFCVIKSVDDGNTFGDTAKLFEAINSNDLHEKLEETLNDMQSIFETNEEEEGQEEGQGEEANDETNPQQDTSNSEKESGPDLSSIDPEKIQEHISGLLDGKIGKLAKEIAEEAAKDMNIDEMENPDNVLKNLFKNPSKIMGLVKNIGGKLDEKMKSGDLKESELLEEASEIVNKMKDMPGLKDMMQQMGMNPGSGKFDFSAMKNHMQNNLKTAKMKERMRQKLKNKQALVATNLPSEISATGNNEYTFSTGEEVIEKSHKSDAPQKKDGKKKRKKKKKKDKIK